MDPEDFDTPDQMISPKTLTVGSTVVVETTADTYILGVMVAPISPGAVVAQTHTEISDEVIESLTSLEDLIYATPIETFIPFTSIHTIRSIQDMTEEGLLAEFKKDIDSYGTEDPPTVDKNSDTDTTKEPLWDRFILLIDKTLKNIGL